MKTEISPTWGMNKDGKPMSIGTRVCEHMQLTMDEFLGLSPAYQARCLEMIDKAIFIGGKNRWVSEKLIEAGLPEQGEEEKAQDWKDRTHEQAKALFVTLPMPVSSLELLKFSFVETRGTKSGKAAQAAWDAGLAGALALAVEFEIPEAVAKASYEKKNGVRPA